MSTTTMIASIRSGYAGLACYEAFRGIIIALSGAGPPLCDSQRIILAVGAGICAACVAWSVHLIGRGPQR